MKANSNEVDEERQTRIQKLRCELSDLDTVDFVNH